MKIYVSIQKENISKYCFNNKTLMDFQMIIADYYTFGVNAPTVRPFTRLPLHKPIVFGV